MSGLRKQVGCQVKGEIAECWCCYSLEICFLPDWDECSRFEPRAGSVMLRLPLVPPCPGVPASPGGSSGGVFAICPGDCPSSSLPCSMASSGLQQSQALFAHKLETALKLPKSHHVPPMRDILGTCQVAQPRPCLLEQRRTGRCLYPAKCSPRCRRDPATPCGFNGACAERRRKGDGW